MRLADLQNQLANMPLNQQFSQAQTHQIQHAPIAINNEFQEEVLEENTTVQEGEESDEKQGIREEDQDRAGRRRPRTRRRAKTIEEEAEEKVAKKRAKDGIHGNYLDVEA
ncbi:MAG: hypothetical protein GC154_01240 [bacterium]|nr:hypothetical protein [bacterium]